MKIGRLITTVSAFAVYMGLLPVAAHSAGLCPEARKNFEDNVHFGAGWVLELDTITDCAAQVKFVDKLNDCADNYLNPQRPVYDQAIAYSECSRKYKFAHLYSRIDGKPYPAHDPEDLAHQKY